MKSWCKAFVMLLSVGTVFAAVETRTVWERLEIPEPLTVLFYAASMSIFFMAVALYYSKSMGKQAKKAVFILICVPIAIATIYLATSTLYLNFESSSGGPVHWHADYEVWACGQQFELLDPTGLDNKVGTPLIHEHNDNRIHVEGTLLEDTDATLGVFFDVIGGKITESEIIFPTNNGIMIWKDGDLCNGVPSKLHVFVNGANIVNPEDHQFAPYTDVPQGDIIKIVFTEKSPDTVNTKLFEVP